MTYGSETWILNKLAADMVDRFERKGSLKNLTGFIVENGMAG